MPPSRPSRPATTLRSVFARQFERVRADPTAEAVTDVGTPRGWLVERGVCDLLEPFVTHLPRDDGDLARYAGLTGDVAAVLLDRLPAVELDDRQNDAPTLGCLLEAAAAHPAEVELHGYLVGPARTDERLTAEGLLVADAPRVDVLPDHGPGCECAQLWAHVQERLGVDDAVRMPDEIRPARLRSRPEERAWSLWWD